MTRLAKRHLALAVAGTATVHAWAVVMTREGARRGWGAADAPAAVALAPLQEMPPPLLPVVEAVPRPPEPQVTWGRRDGQGDAAEQLRSALENSAPRGPTDAPELRRGAAGDAEASEPTPTAERVEPAEPREPTPNAFARLREALRARPSPPKSPTDPPSPTDAPSEPAPVVIAPAPAVAEASAPAPPSDPPPEPAASPVAPLSDDAGTGGTDSDRDADAFSTREGADFRRGKLDARGGRERRLTRPQIDLAFRSDVTRLGLPIGVLLLVTIDAAGTPTDVVVLDSSGSDAIDQAVRMAMFRSWFEPAGDKTFRFGVAFY